VQVLLQEREQQQLAQQLQEGFDAADGAAATAGGVGDQQGKRESSPLRALILTPTRELALQVGGSVRQEGTDSSPVCLYMSRPVGFTLWRPAEAGTWPLLSVVCLRKGHGRFCLLFRQGKCVFVIFVK
jgi:hypothetical protein